MSDTLVKVDNVSKKFCRDLKRSLWYGIRDLGGELMGRTNIDRNDLRPDEFWALRNVSLELKRGECLGLIGRNGAGKTTLLRMLNGLIKPDQGRIEMQGRVTALIALGAGFNPILSGRENIYINASVLGMPRWEVNKRLDEIIGFSELEEFIDTPLQSYSSGMSVRLGFAVAANLNPDILLVDEVLAVGDEGFQRKCLNKIGELKKNGAGIVFVSHNMHAISTFSNRLILMKNGSPTEYKNISKGIRAYQNLFINKNGKEIEKICCGNEDISFYNADINKQSLQPGDSFCISLMYHTKIFYKDIEIDIAISTSSELSFHFQATNRAYNRSINLKEGKNALNISIRDIRVNHAVGKISIAIWKENRSKLLFWWRIPVEFKGVDHATGNTFLDVSYEIVQANA